MTTFALDTATPSPSLALVGEGAPTAELWLGPSPAGGRRVLEAAHHLMRAAGTEPRDLRRIVVGVGPGGFTGLRIGLATAVALGQALGVEVTGASSLEALALSIADWTGREPGAIVVPVIDARRREVFAAAYRLTRDGDLEPVVSPAALGPDALLEALEPVAAEEGPLWLGGDGLDAHGDALTRPGLTPLPTGSPGHRVAATALVRRVDAGAGLPAVPTYLRLPDAEVNRRRAEQAAGRPA